MAQIDADREIKKCNRCHQWKPWEAFNRRHASPICGRQGHCRECDRTWGKDYHKVRKFPVRAAPKKKRIRAKSQKLERIGVLERPEQCQACGCSGVQAHHTTYLRADRVIYLCRFCHEMAHWLEKYGEPHPDDDQDKPVLKRIKPKVKK